jgi:hypothetical protein
MSKFRVFFLVFGPQHSYYKCHQICFSGNLLKKTQDLIFFCRNFYGRYPMDFKFKIVRIEDIKWAQKI